MGVKRTEQVRIHKRTAPHWDKFRAIIDKMDKANEYREGRRTDTELLDMAVHFALAGLDEHHNELYRFIPPLDRPIEPDVLEDPQGKRQPISHGPIFPGTPGEDPNLELWTIESRLKAIEANIKIIMEKTG